MKKSSTQLLLAREEYSWPTSWGFRPILTNYMRSLGDAGYRTIEDCCESQGASLNGKRVGTLSEAGTFSFYWGHHMTTVEGGMLCTDSLELFKLFALKRSHGLAREVPEEYRAPLRLDILISSFDFLFLTDGFNVRNTEFNAVLGLAQLKRINEFIAIRNRNYHRFSRICMQYPEELLVIEKSGDVCFRAAIFLSQKRTEKGLPGCDQSGWH